MTDDETPDDDIQLEVETQKLEEQQQRYEETSD